jgi:hypothetical protein
MTHDESVYPEPFAFKPERFFDKNGELNNDGRVFAYGFGRRYILLFLVQTRSYYYTEFVLGNTLQVQPSVLLRSSALHLIDTF